METPYTRDVALFNIPKFNPEVARRIFQDLATLAVPSKAEIAKEVGRLPRQIEKYLEAFEAIYCTYEIEPHKTSAGKALYYLFDVGLSKYLEAEFQRSLQVWFLNELYSQFSYAGGPAPNVFRSVSRNSFPLNPVDGNSFHIRFEYVSDDANLKEIVTFEMLFSRLRLQLEDPTRKGKTALHAVGTTPNTRPSAVVTLLHEKMSMICLLIRTEHVLALVKTGTHKGHTEITAA